MRSPTAADDAGADDAGAAAAEFAVALPAVALVLAVCVGAIGVGSQQLRLQDAAADAARGLGRAESSVTVAARAARAVPGVSLESWQDGELVCARLAVAARGPAAVAGLLLHAESCALDGGR
ncbi:MAG: TadE/TadG family type IV pilus assembly protein [Protaetiibacter sp.]